MQSPPHPVKDQFELAAAVRVTLVPFVNVWAQVEFAEQLMVPGLEVTVPDPYVVTVSG